MELDISDHAADNMRTRKITQEMVEHVLAARTWEVPQRTAGRRRLEAMIEDRRLIGELRRYPEDPDEHHGLIDLPTDPLVEVICDRIVAPKPASGDLDAIGIALPGIVRAGVVED